MATFFVFDRLLGSSPVPGPLGVLLVTIATLMIGYSMLAARRHNHRGLAIVAPLCGIGVGAAALSIFAVLSDEDQEIAPFYMVLIIIVVYGVPLTTISIVSGLITIRVVRGRWGLSFPGHCPQCDYNLSGLIAAVCPECGADTSGSTASDSNRN